MVNDNREEADSRQETEEADSQKEADSQQPSAFSEDEAEEVHSSQFTAHSEEADRQEDADSRQPGVREANSQGTPKAFPTADSPREEEVHRSPFTVDREEQGAGVGAGDSQGSFMSERNELEPSGVPSSMDNATKPEEEVEEEAVSHQPSAISEEQEAEADSQEDVHSSQFTVHSEEEVEEAVSHQPSAISEEQEAEADSQEDVHSSQFTVHSEEEVTEEAIGEGASMTTGEMESLGANTPAPLESLEPIPTVAFDYDDYYGAPESFGTPPPPPQETQPADTGSKDNKGLMFLGAFAAGILGAALTVGVLAATGSFSEADSAPSTTAAAAPAVATPAPQVTNQIINDIGSSVNPSAVALKVVPSIVTVNVFDQADGDAESLIGTGSGSGVVMSAEGFIITNNHVVEGATNYSVIFEDGRTYEAELVGTDALTDLAILKISADNLVPIEFGSADDLVIGDPAIAVGNPLGQDGGSSVSVGIVSAFDRTVEFGNDSSLFGMLQTDAAINSGSSGGALVDAEGKLIGITSAIGVSQAGPEGIGYAIPIELVDRITAEIIETGDVDHPFLGVTIGTFLEEAPDGAITPSGSDIQTIEGTDSAAGAAGLQPGDVIVRIGDKDISNQIDLILAVRLHRVGDEVEFEALRDGVSMTFDVVMGQRPEEFGG